MAALPDDDNDGLTIDGSNTLKMPSLNDGVMERRPNTRVDETIVIDDPIEEDDLLVQDTLQIMEAFPSLEYEEIRVKLLEKGGSNARVHLVMHELMGGSPQVARVKEVYGVNPVQPENLLLQPGPSNANLQPGSSKAQTTQNPGNSDLQKAPREMENAAGPLYEMIESYRTNEGLDLKQQFADMSVQEYLVMVEDPETYFKNDQRTTTDAYARLCRSYLANNNCFTSIRDIDKIMKENNFLLIPTLDSLNTKKLKLLKRKREKTYPLDEFDEEFFKEVSCITHMF